MKLDYKKIINIKNKKDLSKFKLLKPIFNENYLFHYLIIFDKLNILKLLNEIPIYIENSEGLNGLFLAAKEDKYDILCYFIKKYPEYIYNINGSNKNFVDYLKIERIPNLVKKYSKLDWKYLLSNNLVKVLVSNFTYKNLIDFINIYDIKNYLYYLVKNDNLENNEIINILKKFDINKYGVKMIFEIIEINNKVLFSYLISNKINFNQINPDNGDYIYMKACEKDIINDEYYYTKKIVNIIKDTNPKFYNQTTIYLNNLLHIILFLKMKYNKIDLNLNLLDMCDNITWNQNNINDITPFNLIIYFNFDYSKILTKNKIKIKKSILSTIKKTDNDSSDYLKWINFLNELKEYNEDENEINLEINKIADATLFKSTFLDTKIYFNYLENKYKDLYIPKIKSLKNTELNIENMDFNDVIIDDPLFIYYVGENDYYINPNLNNLINIIRQKGSKKYATTLLSLKTNNTLHANIIIYDFKNMTIERFEPYGFIYNDYVDNLLDEELTWNTGFKYIKPQDYLPQIGFQFISNENIDSNTKPGDFGGFCLAWSLWYLESRLNNRDIEQSILVSKLIKKIDNLNIKFVNYIRNYSNKLADARHKFLEGIGVNKQDLSNNYFDNTINKKIYNSLY